MNGWTGRGGLALFLALTGFPFNTGAGDATFAGTTFPLGGFTEGDAGLAALASPAINVAAAFLSAGGVFAGVFSADARGAVAFATGGLADGLPGGLAGNFVVGVLLAEVSAIGFRPVNACTADLPAVPGFALADELVVFDALETAFAARATVGLVDVDFFLIDLPALGGAFARVCGFRDLPAATLLAVRALPAAAAGRFFTDVFATLPLNPVRRHPILPGRAERRLLRQIQQA